MRVRSISTMQPWVGKVCRRGALAFRVKYHPKQLAKLTLDGPRLAAIRDAVTQLKKTDKAAATRLQAMVAEEEEALLPAQPAVPGDDGTSESSSSSSGDDDASTSSETENNEGTLQEGNELGMEEEEEVGNSQGPHRMGQRRRGRYKKIEAQHWGVRGLVPAPMANQSELIWIENPPALGDARKVHGREVAKHQLRAEAQQSTAEGAQVTAITAALAASDDRVLAAAPPPRDGYHPGAYASLLSEAAFNAHAGSDLALVGEDDPRWQRPLAGTGRQPCGLCLGLHGSTQKDCPVVQAANAVPVTPFVCSHCAGNAVPGCRKCARGELPAHVWVPSEMPAPWAKRLPATMLGVMCGVQGIANAAVVDYDRPDLTAQLTPAALLAAGLLAEEVAQAELQARGL